MKLRPIRSLHGRVWVGGSEVCVLAVAPAPRPQEEARAPPAGPRTRP